jgi:FlaA1/EpsC-like NDP-sugar epimerase
MDTKILNNNQDKTSNEDMDRSIRRYRLPIMIVFYLFSIVFAYLGAYLIRFDFKISSEYLTAFYNTLPLLLFSRIILYYYYKIYSASWRFTYLRDLMDIVKSVIFGSVLFLMLLVFLDKLKGFPRSVILLEAILSISIIAGTRLFFRYYNEYANKRAYKVIKNVFIVGAGKAGVLMLNEIRSNKSLGINTIGFIDDNSYLKGTSIQGVPVLGCTEDIPSLVKKYAIDEVMIAVPSAGYKDIVRISEICMNCGVKANILPGLGRLIQDGFLTGQLNDVLADELLGRKVIKFSRESDRALMEGEVKGNAVLITGAGGSIGSELCRQVVRYHPKVLIMYERYESALYEIELEMRKRFPDILILPVLGDILDAGKLSNVIQSNSVNLIYHAAAHKHVPMMEREPIEAVRNNIIGTMNVAKLAIKNNVNKFVLISTDKAVNPVNIMGATKRVAELLTQALNGNGTRFISVRFGNVIGSNGSVIPIFKKQIAEGGPVTITHPEMTRYFMAISEAVQLVMTAGAMGSGGEIFLLDMGKPVKITDVAKALIKLSGLETGKDIDIVFSGIRPGEKLYEELFWKGEGIVPTDNKRITMLKPNRASYNGFLDKIKLLEEDVAKGDIRGMVELLVEIAPEATIKDNF